MRRQAIGVAVLGVLLGVRPAAGDVSAAAGHAVRLVPTPGTVQGGVVRRDGATLVGQGEFGVGTQAIVRLDAGGATTIASGFNSLGGFDLDAAGTLWVVDNAGELVGATTGDTLFAIPDALSRATPLAAAGAEAVPAGTIPNAFDVVVAPDGSVLVTDAPGDGLGRVVRVAGGVATDVVTGLDYAAGMALTAAGVLLVGDVDAVDFVGSVRAYTLDGRLTGTIATGLSGTYGLALDGAGNVVVSGGLAADASGSVIAIAPDGTRTERARGFAFSTDLYFDATRDELLVLDFGARAVVALCRDRDEDGVCDADDNCPDAANGTQSDGDDDGTGDACDACTGGVVERARLVVTGLGGRAGDEQLRLRGRLTLAAEIDPLATGAEILIAGARGPILEPSLPALVFDPVTRRGWRAKRGRFTYLDRSAGVLGVLKARLVSSRQAPGRVGVLITGRKGRYRVEDADLPLRATLVLGATGQCGEAVFGGAAPGSGCRVQARKGKVRCR